MKELTQTRLNPYGNCWQTAIACVLDLDPETMPPQSYLEEHHNAKCLKGWGSYNNHLNVFLDKHFRLCYGEIYYHQFGSVKPIRSLHTMNGPTVRTSAFKESGSYHVNHCVVAQNGRMVWDVHPSRAGLLQADSWGIIGKKMPVRDPERIAKMMEDPAYALVHSCLCPECNLDKFKELVAEEAAEAKKEPPIK